MQKTVKRISALLLTLLILGAALPVPAFAAGPIDTEQPVDCTVIYKDGSKPIPNAKFDVYKVADVDESFNLTLTADFEPYKNSVAGLADLESLDANGWLDLAATLKPYARKDGLTPIATDFTDADGNLNLTLKPGLYLFAGYRTTIDDFNTYTLKPFMMMLPGMKPGTNTWSYDVDANIAVAKFEKDIYPPDQDDKYVSRKVLKIWKDSGYETIRPASVTVQLLKDGSVYDTQKLTADNNWRYAWDDLDGDHEWEVTETLIPGYALTTAKNGITYTLTNKYIAPITVGDPPVQKRLTGDTPPTPASFVFTMTAKDPSFPMPEGSVNGVKEMTIVGAGSKEFGQMTFTKAGVYEYTVAEKATGAAGYTYDKTVYTVTYTVTETDGDLHSEMKIVRNGETANTLEFTNNYKKPSEKLPQTGMLWWPVPVLICLGLAMVTVGIARRRKDGQ